MGGTEAPPGPDAGLRVARAGRSRLSASPEDAFAAARATYLAGRRLDMRELAAGLGVSRTTLYRWCGDREQLLTDVIWSVTAEAISQFESATSELRGRLRLRTGVELFLQFVATDNALQAFIANETHAALRLMTTDRQGNGYQDRLVAELTRLIAEENEREDMQLGAAPELAAYTIVRVLTGFVYNDSIAAVEPQLDKAMEVLDFILRWERGAQASARPLAPNVGLLAASASRPAATRAGPTRARSAHRDPPTGSR